MQRRCEQDSTLFLTPELGELTLLTSNECGMTLLGSAEPDRCSFAI
jgi:hypothetical protein